MRGTLLITACVACGSPTTAGEAGDVDAAETTDTNPLDPPPPPPSGDYHTSLTTCWNDPSCQRVFAVAHGGSWNAQTAPYDSNAAIQAAFAAGDEGIKIDVRVTKDNVPVIAHSSPLEIYESLDCANRKIEDMTAAEVTGCHRFPSSSETFQRLDEVLDYVRGKMVVQLCVKKNADFARTITEIHARNAADFAFVEINAGDVGLIQGLDAPDIYFLVNVASDLTAVDTVLALHDPRLFLIEIDPDVAIGDLVATKIHPGGARAFTYDNAASPTTSQLQAHYAAGYDVVSSQSGPKGVEARQAANGSRGITPP